MSNADLFAKLAAEEEQFFNSEFLSPVVRGRPVRVRISGITVTLKVRPANFEGWGIFRSEDQTTARHVGEPTRAQKRQYLELYPKFSMIMVRVGEVNTGIPANRSDDRVQIQGQIPVLLPDAVQLFDCVDVRWDGENFWFDRPARFRNPRMARYLRESLADALEPDKIELAGLSQEERVAYRLAHLYEIESQRDRKEERVRAAIENGGATFRSYVERGNSYTVEFSVGGERHRSVVDSDTLQVQSAGICLNGGDRHFDLQSLISVIREGQNRHLIYRVGNNR